tara:strand:- start:4522 stop:4800 length:279 start_codon:yes stop_codon:yes gene_type:complete
MNYPTTSKKDLYLWMEEKNLQMSQYLDKAENNYTVDLLDKLWQDLDSGVIPGKETSTFYNEVKSRKDANPAPFDIEEYKAIDFCEIIDSLPD